MVDYNDMFILRKGTTVSRLTDALRYAGTGNGGTVRVNVDDLRVLINFYEIHHVENSQRQLDADLRCDPEIVNIPDAIERERRIKEKMNFKEAMK